MQVGNVYHSMNTSINKDIKDEKAIQICEVATKIRSVLAIGIGNRTCLHAITFPKALDEFLY